MKFIGRKPHYEYLRNKWMLRHSAIQNKFWEKHGDSLKHLALGSLGGLMLFSGTNQQIPAHNLIVSREGILKDYDQNVLLAQVLSEKLPKEIRPLDSEEEKDITEILS
ncbi:MAG: hypothetical protein Q8Q86_02485, partial [Candidatus Daviesbacteria bacterium]|nr:hypothetical protein [Candidatus Daviesbacteria bacterium]